MKHRRRLTEREKQQIIDENVAANDRMASLFGLTEEDMPLPIDMLPVKSKMIHSVGYDSTREVLRITFNKKDGTPGNTYDYKNVGGVCYLDLCKAESIGKFFLQFIKPIYGCERLPDETEAQEATTQAQADAEATGSDPTEKA